MSSNVNSDVVYSNYQGNTSTFIKEIIGEMKYHFNKSEHKNGVSKTEENVEVEKVNMEVNQIQDLEIVERTNISENDKEKAELAKESIWKDSESDHSKSKVESSLFKRPSDESISMDTKKVSPAKRPLRQKEEKEKNTVKRSLRCRAKNSTKSILQSAIARKEKSYNESIKPQRLTRQKKSKKILDSCEQVKPEKIKETIENGTQYKHDITTSDGEVNKQESSKASKKKIKKIKISCSNEIESDSFGSMSDESEYLRSNIESSKMKTRYLFNPISKRYFKLKAFLVNLKLLKMCQTKMMYKY